MVELLPQFTSWLEVKGYAPRSVVGFGADAKDFISFCLTKDVNDIRGVSAQVLYAYQQTLFEKVNPRNGQRLAVTTRNRYLSVVKAFFRCVKELGLISDDPAADIRHARTPKRLPSAIPTNAEIRQILEMPDTSTAIGFRDRCILELFYTSGIRVTELVNLKITDVNFEDGVVQIFGGKGNKDGVVPIGKIASRYLKHYLAEVRPLLDTKGNTEALFLTLGGRQFAGRKMIETMVVEATKKAGIKKRVTPHSFRHAMATHMMRRNAPIRVIQEILRHESLESTQVYTRVTIMDLKAVHARCHPRNHDEI
jgi:integrase/recombinase XerD